MKAQTTCCIQTYTQRVCTHSQKHGSFTWKLHVSFSGNEHLHYSSDLFHLQDAWQLPAQVV